jgi:hypothetical protein
MLKSCDSLCSLINFVPELPASLPPCRLFQRKIEVSNFFEVPPDCYCTSVNTTWRTASLMQNLCQLFLLDPILRRFRILRCNRQAALHSAMFNYTPLVIRRTDKNKQLTIVKPTQTGINRNK